MKKQAFKSLSMVALLLVIAAVSVSAQSDRRKVINIPFSFIVGDKTLVAGDYTVHRNRRDYDTIWLVQSSDGRSSILFSTMSVRASRTQDQTKLVFRKYGDRYFLAQVWTPGGNTGRELPQSKLERELAKNKIESQSIVLPEVASRN